MRRVLIYAYVFSLPLISFSVVPWFGFQLSYAIITILGLLIVVDGVLTRRIIIVRSRVNGAVLVFGVASLVSVIGIVMSTCRGFSRITLLEHFARQAITLCFMVTMYFVLLACLRDKRTFKNALKVLLVSVFVCSLYGLYQLVGAYMDLPYRRLLFNNPSFSLAMGEYPFMGFYRITSFCPEPAMFANLLLCAIPVVAMCSVNKVKILGSLKWNVVIFAILLIAFLLTFSRGGYIVLFVVLSTMSVFLTSFKLRAFLRMAGLVVLVVLIGLFVSRWFGIDAVAVMSDRVFSTLDFKDLSILERSTSIVAAFNIFLSHPLFGVGLGNFGFYFYEYMPDWGYMQLTDSPASNNLLFRIASESGLVGIVAFLYFIWAVTKEGLSAIRYEKENVMWRSLSVGLLLSFFAVLLHLIMGIATFNFSHFWFLTAAIVVINNLRRNQGIAANLEN